MKSRTLLALLAVFLATWAGFSPVQSSAEGQAARMCAPTNAEKTTVAAIAADPSAWLGRCVTLPAIYSNEQLYADADAIYGLNGHVIGGFTDGKGTIEGFWNGQFTGRVADCAQAEREQSLNLLRSPGISVNGRPMGCPEPKGPFLIFMSQRDLKPVNLVRRLRKDVGPNEGDLQPVSKDWPQFAPIEKVTRDFVAALQSGDRQALTAFSLRDFDVERLLTDETNAVTDLRKLAGRQMQIFADRTSTSAEACFCRTKDCSAKWPIASRDADNQTSRPYACIRITPNASPSNSFDNSFSIDPGQDFGGLPEPR